MKYLKINSLPFEFSGFSPNDVQVLKTKFPILELFIVPKGTILEPLPNVDFEKRQEIGKGDEEFFSFVSQAFFE